MWLLVVGWLWCGWLVKCLVLASKAVEKLECSGAVWGWVGFVVEERREDEDEDEGKTMGR